jgi:hypothetical protein
VIVWLRIGNTSNHALLRWFVPLWPEIMRCIGLGDRLIEVPESSNSVINQQVAIRKNKNLYHIRYMSWILMITYATIGSAFNTEYVLPYEFLRDDKIA